jgi:hypothetical protein
VKAREVWNKVVQQIKHLCKVVVEVEEMEEEEEKKKKKKKEKKKSICLNYALSYLLNTSMPNIIY